MALRFLDLDPVRQPIGTFRFEGNDYTVWPMRLENMINLQAIQAQGEQADIGHLLAIVQQTVPDCPPEVLTRLDSLQLNALTAWAQGTAEGDAEKNSDAPSPNGAAPTPHEVLSAPIAS